MATLTEKEIEALKIEHFIFHVVHHGEPDAILFDDTPLGTFEPFFIDRIKETLRGNKFSFAKDSHVQEKLIDWQAKKVSFVDLSKSLARQFHGPRDKRVKPGVLIVIALATGKKKLYSLIKFDSEKVVTFQVKGAKAILEAVTNNFTESPKALQKSALIDLGSKDAEVVVIDKISRSGISDFFKKFLGVERLRNSEEMTNDIVKAIQQTVKIHLNELPPAITSKVSEKIVEIAGKRKEFEADSFFADFFGVKETDEIRVTYDRELSDRKLVGEVFIYDEGALPRSDAKKYVTFEGITINIPAKAKNSFSYKDDKNGTTITIRTSRLREK